MNRRGFLTGLGALTNELWGWLGWLLCEAAFRTDCRIPGLYRAGNWCYGRWSADLDRRGL